MVGLPRSLRSPRWLPGLVAILLAGACDSDPIEARVVALDAVPVSLVFPTVPVGVADESVVIVTNRGNAPWTPGGPPAVAGPGFTWVSGCDVPVGPDAVCEVRVRFAPLAEGPASGTITLSAPGVGVQGSDIVVNIDLVGEGGPAVLRLTPPTIAFPAVPVGDFLVEVVTAENIGTADLVFDVVASPEAFRVAGGQSARVSLAPGERRDLNVTFVPRQGGPFTGNVTAQLCGPGCGPAVLLTGEGAAPRIDATPRSVDFGRVGVGNAREATVTLENVGAGALRIDDVELVTPSPDLTLVIASDLPLTLLDGETAEVTLRYGPAAGREALDALVVVRSNDPLSPEVFIPVDGTTPGRGLVVLPTAAHFGRLGDGASREVSLIVRSVGTDDITALQLALEGDAFSFVSAAPAGGLRAGEALQVPVRATASAGVVVAGGATGRLLATGDGVAATAALAVLAGTSGCVPVATVAHASLGIVPLGTGAQGAVVIDNVGDASCALLRFEPGGSGLGFDQDFSAAPRGLLELPPGGTGTVQFAFLATRAGARQAVVELGFADVAAPLFVSASASAIDGDLAALPPRVTLGPIPRACGDVIGASAVVNTGATALTIDRVELAPPGPITVDVGALPFSLLPGASRAVRVIGRTGASPVGVSEATATFRTTVGIATDLRVTLDIVSEAEPVRERFTVAPASSVDILFVVDNSGSMADDQELLARNFASFFALGLVGGAPSFQVGVTTTDVISTGAARGALVGAPPVLTASTTSLEERFATNVRVGVEGTGLELGLEAMRLALEHPDNGDFLRRDAALSVIFVTDEEDAGAFPEVLPDAALSRSPDDYIALLAALKAGTVGNAPILVSGVVATGAASRYEALVRHFGGTLLDIRTPDWGERLSEVGNDTFALARSFPLGSEPVDGSLVVEVDGQPTTAFSYDPGRQSVVLDAPPRPGATVDVSYQSGCR